MVTRKLYFIVTTAAVITICFLISYVIYHYSVRSVNMTPVSSPAPAPAPAPAETPLSTHQVIETATSVQNNHAEERHRILSPPIAPPGVSFFYPPAPEAKVTSSIPLAVKRIEIPLSTQNIIINSPAIHSAIIIPDVNGSAPVSPKQGNTTGATSEPAYSGAGSGTVLSSFPSVTLSPYAAKKDDKDAYGDKSKPEKHDAVVSYSIPGKITIGDSVSMVAAIRVGDEIEKTINRVKSELQGGRDSEIKSKNLRLSDFVKVTLKGKQSDVEITPAGEDVQEIFSDVETFWKWDVTPKVSGKIKLILSIQSVQSKDSLRLEQADETFILVDSCYRCSVISYIKQNIDLKWLWATILLPAFYFLRHRLKIFTKLR